MKNPLTIACLSLSAALVACLDSGSSSPATRVSLVAQAMPHQQAKADDETPRSFQRSDGMRIDLELGLINIVPVALLSCPSLSKFGRQTLMLASDALLGRAHAHAGEDHGDNPTIGYSNALRDDAVYFGALSPAPGRYCGIRLTLDNASETAAKHGAALDRSMQDVAVNVAPCYYPNSVTAGLLDGNDPTHSCIQLRLPGDERTLELDFPAPLDISAEQRLHGLTLEMHYVSWFDGLDMDALSSSANEQAKLLDNIRASLIVSTVVAQ